METPTQLHEVSQRAMSAHGDTDSIARGITESHVCPWRHRLNCTRYHREPCLPTETLTQLHEVSQRAMSALETPTQLHEVPQRAMSAHGDTDSIARGITESHVCPWRHRLNCTRYHREPCLPTETLTQLHEVSQRAMSAHGDTDSIARGTTESHVCPRRH